MKSERFQDYRQKILRLAKAGQAKLANSLITGLNQREKDRDALSKEWKEDKFFDEPMDI